MEEEQEVPDGRTDSGSWQEHCQWCRGLEVRSLRLLYLVGFECTTNIQILPEPLNEIQFNVKKRMAMERVDFPEINLNVDTATRYL